MEAATLGRAAVTFVVLLSALGFVTWRQSRALEVLSNLEAVRRDASEARAIRIELERNIRFLESRAHIVPEARERLGMHTPDASELVILAGEPAS